MSRRILAQSLLTLALCFSLVAPVLANGGKAKNEMYEGFAQPKNGKGLFTFTIESSPVIFYLGTVNNKYHVLLIRVRNQSNVPLKLSKDDDTVGLEFIDLHTVTGKTVKGLLNLKEIDPATWDGLEGGLRTAIAYPEVVPAGEEEGIYLYVPVKDLAGPRKEHDMPVSITYGIKSLPAPVTLSPPGVAKS
jgi:hypothetical protein